MDSECAALITRNHLHYECRLALRMVGTSAVSITYSFRYVAMPAEAICLQHPIRIHPIADEITQGMLSLDF
eukprot:1289296-Karenia_brevis.AAC.1